MAIQHSDVNEKKAFTDGPVNKVTLVKTDVLSLDVYYYKKGQAIGYHKHPTGDQIFTVLAGAGTFKLDDGKEQTLAVKAGSVVVAPADVWHDLIDGGNGDLIAQQVTKQPAGMEKRS